MSKYHTEHINGDLLVEHDINIGGSAVVQGEMVVKHGIRIEGWLDAPNISGPNKGFFMTVEDLRETYPMPDNGWLAGVMGSGGERAVFYAYISKNGGWISTGKELSTGNISMEEVLELIRENQREPIALTMDASDITRWYSAEPFYPDSETLMVNGVHYYKPDYSLIEHDGVAIGVVVPFYEEGWEVRLVGDIVE